MARGDDTFGPKRFETIEPTAFRPPGALTRLAWPSLPWRRLLVIATLACTTAAVAFIFAARSVEFDVAPSHARLSVGGGLAPHFGARYMLLPGNRRVAAEAPGYRPLRTHVKIGRAPHQVLALTMTPLPGHLDITLEPAVQARVFIDELPAGAAPGRISGVAAGAREIRVQAPRYLEFATTLDVIGKDQAQPLAVTLAPAWAELEVASKPDGAQVLSDDDVLGVTPLKAELLQGPRRLRVSRPGYKPWERRIEVVAGQPVSILDVRLQKDDGHFSVTSIPPGAAVTVDGRFKGETPVRFAVSPDVDHALVVMKSGYVPARERVAAESGAVRDVALTLTPELAVIELATTPADAELLLDGQPRGSATQRLELPTHEHEIIVRKPGFATYRTRVTPRKGVVKRLEIRLKTAAEMAALEATRAPAAAAPAAATGATSAAPGSPDPATAAGNAEAQRVAETMVAPFLPPELAGPGTAPVTAVAPPPAFAGEGLVRSSLGQELRLVRGGAFRGVGSVAVRLQRPYYLGLREVSNAEYRRFIGSHVTQGAAGHDLNADHLPVANLPWEAAAAYCNWLSRRESLPPFYQIRYGRVLGVNPDAAGYRLPTEAEWDFAARIAPDDTALEFPWSGRFPPRGRVGNFADQAARELVARVIAGYEDGFAASAPVGSFPPNLRGFHDLGGNVSEWIHNVHADAMSGGSDPLGASSGIAHVVRGSSWRHAAPAELALAYRSAGGGPRPDLGFRLARYAQ